jgi:hypothetical protein
MYVDFLEKRTTQQRNWKKCERLLWVKSSLSASYQANGCFRVYTGRSQPGFLAGLI